MHTTLYVSDHRKMVFPGATPEDLRLLCETFQVFGNRKVTETDKKVHLGRSLPTENFALNWVLDHCSKLLIPESWDDGKCKWIVRAELDRINIVDLLYVRVEVLFCIIRRAMIRDLIGRMGLTKKLKKLSQMMLTTRSSR